MIFLKKIGVKISMRFLAIYTEGLLRSCTFMFRGDFFTSGLNGVNDCFMAPSYKKQLWNIIVMAMMAAVSAYEKWYGESSDGRSILRSAINASVTNPPEGMDI